MEPTKRQKYIRLSEFVARIASEVEQLQRDIAAHVVNLSVAINARGRQIEELKQELARISGRVETLEKRAAADAAKQSATLGRYPGRGRSGGPRRGGTDP